MTASASYESAVRRQVEKIIPSRGFAASPRMSRFLRFAAGYALSGRAGEPRFRALLGELGVA